MTNQTVLDDRGRIRGLAWNIDFRPTNALATLVLDQGSSIRAEAGAMVAMGPGIELTTEVEGSLWSAVKRSAGDPEHVPALTAAMADVTHGAQSEVLEGYRLPPGTVADIGGADGSVLAALVADEPDRRGWLVDLPAVAATAHEQLATAGLADRVEVLGGDFFESVPSAQVYLLSTVLHDWDDDDALRILGRIRAAAAAGARLVVVEVVLPDGDEPHLGKISDLAMLTMAGGRERTRSEFAGLLDRSGFALDQVARSSVSGYSVIEATVRDARV